MASREIKIVVGLLVLGGLSTAVYYQVKKDQKIGAPTDIAKADLPEIKGSDELDKISIVNGEKGEVVLEKKGDKWMLTKPVNAIANQVNVKSLVDNMKELKVTEVIASTADDELKKTYELDPKKGVHVMAWKGGDKKVDETFGKSGGRGDMVMVEGKPAIYAGKGYSGYIYTREAKEWRDKEVFKFDDANVTSMTIENANGNFSFTKGEKWAASFKDKPIDKLDEGKIKEAIGAFKTLTADDFGDGKSPADTGLDKPAATVTIKLKDNAGTYILRVGKVASGTSHYAFKEGGDGTIYSIPSFSVDWANADKAKFQMPPDGGAKDSGPAPIPEMPMMPPGMGGMGMPPGMRMPPGHP